MDGYRSNGDEAQSDAAFHISKVTVPSRSAEFQMHHQVIKLKQAFLSVTSVVEFEVAERSCKELQGAKWSSMEWEGEARSPNCANRNVGGPLLIKKPPTYVYINQKSR